MNNQKYVMLPIEEYEELQAKKYLEDHKDYNKIMVNASEEIERLKEELKEIKEGQKNEYRR